MEMLFMVIFLCKGLKKTTRQIQLACKPLNLVQDFNCGQALPARRSRYGAA
jgi:hypothetical protein